ncbi:tetratricopeptide repeat protein [Pyxidicoccus fallax]|nr:hypothetical protein [Pyxidicoccus fallax]
MASPNGQAPLPAAKPAASAPGGATSGTHSTHIFGGGRSATMSTQLFGSGPHPNPAAGASTPAPVADTTQVPPPPSIPPVSTPRTSGTVPALGSTVPGNGTQTFGAVPAQGATPPGNGTQPFGAVPAQGSTAAGNTTRTFGAVPAQGTAPSSNGTQTFGAIPAADAPAPIGKTHTFGAVPAEPQQGPVGQGAGTDRTTVFGAVGAPSDQGSGIQLPPESPSPMGSETQLPFGSNVQGGAGSLPISGSHPRRPPMELPPELLAGRDSSGDVRFDSGKPGRERLFILLAVVAGLVLTSVLAYPAWRDRNADVPVAAVEDLERAAVLLRRDDPASREQAIQRLRALSAAHPRYVEAQAELVVALSMRLSDVMADAERLRTRTDLLNRVRADAAGMRDIAGRNLRAAAANKELADIANEMEPIREESNKLRGELDAQLATLAKAPEVEPAPALVARVKARALHAGVTVAPDALMLAERLRSVEGASKLWSTLARAEYALSSGSPPDSLAEVARELEALRKADSTLLRAYVLGARVALRLDDPATARSLLDDTLALNRHHQLASKLLSQLDTAAGQP